MNCNLYHCLSFELALYTKNCLMFILHDNYKPVGVELFLNVLLMGSVFPIESSPMLKGKRRKMLTANFGRR